MSTYEADVGVLIVHGVGSQKSGSTLRDFADPMLQHLREQCPPSDHESPPRVEPLPADENEPTVFARVRVSGGHADQRWLIREARWSEAFDVPSPVEVAKWLSSIGPWFVFFFIARLWRRFGAGWMSCLVGAMAAGSLIAAIIEACLHNGSISIAWLVAAVALVTLGGWASGANKRFAAVTVAVSILLVYPLAGLAAVALLLLSVAGSLPIPGAEKLRKLQTSLAGSIGDVYALIGNQRREQAMLDVIAHSLEQLVVDNGKSGSQPVVIVAHSQGAALVYRLLRWQWPECLRGRPVTLITYGSAIVPVHILEYRLRPGNGRNFWFRLVVFFGFVSLLGLVVLLVHTAGGHPPPWLFWLADGILLASATGSALSDAHCLERTGAKVDASAPTTAPPNAQDESSGESRTTINDLERARAETAPTSALGATRLGRQLRRCAVEATFLPGLDNQADHLRWIDLWAAWDPVPNGPLLLDHPRAIPRGPGGYRSLEPMPPPSGPVFPEPYLVSNTHQPWKDHVVYRLNREDWVGRVAMEIAATAGLADPSAQTAFEHADGVGAVAESPGHLVNERAERGRRYRQYRGIVLFSSQVLLLATSVVAISFRWRELPRLGSWIDDHAPQPIVSLISSIIDFIPEKARDAVAGPSRDASMLHGVIAVLIGVGAVFVGQAYLMQALQAQSSSKFAQRERPAEGLRTLRWDVPAGLAVFVLAAAPLWLGFAVVKASSSNSVATKITIVLEQQPAPGTVTLQPIGKNDDAAIVVAVAKTGTSVRLRSDQTFAVTSEVPGAKDCQTVFSTNAQSSTPQSGATITITCTAPPPSAYTPPTGS